MIFVPMSLGGALLLLIVVLAMDHKNFRLALYGFLCIAAAVAIKFVLDALGCVKLGWFFYIVFVLCGLLDFGLALLGKITDILKRSNQQ